MTDFDYKKYSLENLENWLHDAISSGEATPDEVYDVILKVVRESYYYHKHHASQAYELLSKLNGNNGWTVEDVMKEREYYEPSMPPWGHSDLEYAIHHKEPLSCDKDDPSPECKGAWDDFWEDVDEKHSREYNLREAEYYNKRAELDALSKEIEEEGGYEWTPIPSKDVPYPLYMNKKGEICSPDYVFKKDKVVKWQLPVQQKIEEGVDDYYVQFPDDLLEAANLKEGDQIEWVDNGNGTYTLRKVG